jgi:hypothetical protein
MKKATLTIGLFTLVMVLTSFTTTETTASTIAAKTKNSPIDGSGGQDSGGNRKHDFVGDATITATTIQIADIDGSGGQDSGGNRKHD